MANVKLGTKAVGSIVKIKVNGASKDFIVVQQGNPNTSTYDSSCNGTLLLMKDIYTTSTFGNNNSYKDSSIHTYLNGTFYNLIDSNIRAAIKQVKIPYQNGTGSGGSLATGSNGLSTKVFLLSGYEVGWTTSDNGYFPKDGVRLAYFGNSSSGNSKRIDTMAAPLPFGGCALRASTVAAAAGASAPMAPSTAAGTATPMVFAPLSFFPLHSWSLTMARSVSTLHLPSARTAQLWGGRTRPLRGSTPSGIPTATP